MTIGQRIKQKRLECGYSQDELATKLGYKSRSSINKIETDARNLTQSKIKAIADALGTTPSYIMGWEDEPNLDATVSASYIVECLRDESTKRRLEEYAEMLIKLRKIEKGDI